MNQENNWRPVSFVLQIFVGIVTVISLFFTFFKENEIKFSKEQLPVALYIIAGALVISIALNYHGAKRWIEKISSRIYFLIQIVIKYRRSHIELLDMYGEKAMYNEECLFTRIRRKEGYNSEIIVDGKIDNEIHTYNCTNSLNHKNNVITINYGKKNEDIDVIHNRRQLQFGFVITFLNTFPKKEESWDTRFKHYTKAYDLKFSFFKENPPRDVDIYEVTFDSEGKEKLNRLSIDPLIMEKYNRLVMKVKLLHVKKGKRIRVTWNWNKPEKPETGGTG